MTRWALGLHAQSRGRVNARSHGQIDRGNKNRAGCDWYWGFHCGLKAGALIPLACGLLAAAIKVTGIATMVAMEWGFDGCAVQ